MEICLKLKLSVSGDHCIYSSQAPRNLTPLQITKTANELIRGGISKNIIAEKQTEWNIKIWR